jgi:putative PIN family toxin of toxin-antitoxin system
MSEQRFAVIDTNAAISYYLGNKSEAHAAISHLRQICLLLASEETLAEFQDVMLREKFARIPVSIRRSFIANYRELVTVILPHVQVRDCIDPTDNKFLSLAVSGNASVILSDDKHLRQLHPFRGVDIVSPKTYLQRTGISLSR